jgi:drug/metabolite transporter (DMT)-like permease
MLSSEPAMGAACALGSACLWALTSLIVRTLAPALNAVTVNAVRSLLGGAVLVVVVLLGAGISPFAAISATSLALLGLSIVAAIAIGDTVFFESTRRLGLARGMTIAMTYPLQAALLAAVFLGEPLTPRVAAGSAVTLAGLVLIVLGRSDDRALAGEWWAGIGGATLAALAWAISMILLEAPLAEVGAVTAQAVRLPLAAAVLLVTPWGRGAVRALRASERWVLVRLGVLGGLTAVSSVMFVAAVKYGGVAVAAVLTSTAPMFAIPLGLVFLGERLRATAVAGTLVTVAGIVVLQG